MSAASLKEVAVVYGDRPDKMIPRLLDHFDLAARIPSGAKVGIKPNLVVAKPSNSGATTDPNIVSAIVGYLKHRNINHIVILESAWVGDDTGRAFDVCGYRAISQEWGIPVVDLKQDAVKKKSGGGMEINVCAEALAIDFLINVPVLKVHSQTRMTCALKNLKGVIPDFEKQRFHRLGLHRPIAALSSIVKSDFVVVDALIGDLSHEEGGTPIVMNRLFAGDDAVLVDTYAARLLGYSVDDIPYIHLAETLGVGTTKLDENKVVSLNSPMEAPTDIHVTGVAKHLSERIDARCACSPCIGGLIHALVRLEEEAQALPSTICVGQGFKKTAPEVGIGTCTMQGKHALKGCPPSATAIINFLRGLH